MTDKENARPGDSRNNGRKADKPPRKYQSRASKATADYPPVTLEEAQRALYCIPADCSEEEWSKAGMAFSAEFPNRLDIFDRWSATATISGKYNSTDLKSRWNNRWTRHQGIGIGSLFEIAKTYGYQPNRSTAPLSPEAQARAEQERAKRQAETQRKAEEAAAKAVHGAQRAAAEHQKAPPVPPSHGYPVRKKLNVEILNAWGCRLFRGNLSVDKMAIDGCLMVPALDMNGTIKSLQFIHPDIPGKYGKKNLPKATIKGHFWRLGEFSETGPIYLAEGLATAASIHEASGACTLCTFSGNSMEAVADKVREYYPHAEIILCADNDPTDNQSGQVNAILAAQAVNGLIVIPDLAGHEGKDFNDQYQTLGLEAVRASLAATYTPDAFARQLLANPNTPDKTRRKLLEYLPTGDADIPEESPPEQPESRKPDSQPAEDKAEYIKRLARLSKLDFALIKKEAAHNIGITAGELAEIVKDTRIQLAGANQETQGRKIEPYEADPWPIPVEGAEVLNNAYHAIKRHMAIKDECAIITALWTVHTHIFDIFRHTPRLTITAPNAECGKSVLSHIIEGLVTRPLSCEGLTPAPFFCVIEIHHPTLLIDECDTFFKQDSGLISGINGGFEPGGGQMRCEGEEHIPMIYSTHTPIVLIGITAVSCLTSYNK